jgi:hypothetical protein
VILDWSAQSTERRATRLEGHTMTIWMGEKGSPAVYKGTFSADGNTIEGEWEWPGGGYKETMTRARA